MKKVACLCVLSLAFLVLSGGTASAAVIDSWTIDTANATSLGLIDSIGGKNAVAAGVGTTTPATLIAGATGTANQAAVDPGNGSTSGGYKTTLTSLGPAFTFEVMFKFTSYGYRHGYLTDRAGGPITINMTGSYFGYVPLVTIGATAMPTIPAYTMTLNTWYDIALTYDGTTANFYVTPYSPTATANLLKTAAVTATASSAQGLSLGNADGSKYGIGGAIDWAVVYNTALTAAQISGDIQRNGALIPEPATMSLLVLGGLAALIRRRRGA